MIIFKGDEAKLNLYWVGPWKESFNQNGEKVGIIKIIIFRFVISECLIILTMIWKLPPFDLCINLKSWFHQILLQGVQDCLNFLCSPDSCLLHHACLLTAYSYCSALIFEPYYTQVMLFLLWVFPLLYHPYLVRLDFTWATTDTELPSSFLISLLLCIWSFFPSLKCTSFWI